MSADEKLDFYLKHRAQIEEWCALRSDAQKSLGDALRAAGESLKGNSTLPPLSVTKIYSGEAIVLSPVNLSTRVVVYWQEKSLFVPAAGVFAYAVLAIDSPTKNQVVKELTRNEAKRLGIAGQGAQFLWRTPVPFDDGVFDLDAYAEAVTRRLCDVCTALSPLLEEAELAVAHGSNET